MGATDLTIYLFINECSICFAFRKKMSISIGLKCHTLMTESWIRGGCSGRKSSP